MNITAKHRSNGSGGFTMIELLTVITIMGIIAALVVTMGQTASVKKKMTAVEAQKNRLITMINNYQAKLNYYPPDNGLLATATLQTYDGLAATNPLIYELTGGTNTGLGTLIVFNSSNSTLTVSINNYTNLFNRGGIANGDTQEPHNFFQPGPSSKDYSPYPSAPSTALPICGLVVPVDYSPAKGTNFWHYDSSTTNRHNLNSYDLWAEFYIGSKNGRPKIITNGNW